MTKQKKVPWQCRQGDVFLERIAAPPKTGKPIPRESGRIVLAHGEATGHAHVIEHRKARLLDIDREDHTAVGDEVWANVIGILRANGQKLTLKHDCPGQAKPDHDTIPLPPGDYAVITQLQYTPEAIIPVAD